MKHKYKICTGCGERLIIQRHFVKNPDGADGYRNVCKTCQGTVKIKRAGKESYPFFTPEILSLCRHHRYIEVKKFGYFYGILIILRVNEILAFSVLADTKQGSKIFSNQREARAWLYKFTIEAGERTMTGLARKAVKYAKM
jgi:hypothetical protein